MQSESIDAQLRFIEHLIRNPGLHKYPARMLLSLAESVKEARTHQTCRAAYDLQRDIEAEGQRVVPRIPS